MRLLDDGMMVHIQRWEPLTRCVVLWNGIRSPDSPIQILLVALLSKIFENRRKRLHSCLTPIQEHFILLCGKSLF